MTTSPSTTTKKTDPVEMYKRGIKRDPAIYPVLSDMAYWDNWRRSVTAHAKSQDVDEVLDSNYMPSTQKEYDIFEIKQKFMYSVFNRIIQVDIGKSIVRKHKRDNDAQSVYKELLDEATNSTSAQIKIMKLTETLTSMKLDSKWKSTTVGFLTFWSDQLRKLEDMTDTADHYSDAVKRRMLENAVSQVEEL